MREADLRAFWASRFSIRSYRTEEGKEVFVKFPGFESEGAGPDFTKATIVFGGLEQRGDVEVHRRRGDWRAHGHHCDPRYEGVILHVVLRPEGPRAKTALGREVPTISLLRNLGDMLEGLVMRAKEEAERPCPFAPPGSSLEAALDELSVERLRRKASRFRKEIEGGKSPDQAFYEGLAEALGYIKNRRPMLELAKALPFSRARTFRDMLELSRLMLRTASEVRGWSIWGTRPPNFPLPRIRGLSALAIRFSKEGFLGPLVRALERPRKLVDLFLVKGMVGEGRARVVAINVALPFVLAVRPDLCGEVLRAWRSLPPEPENRILRMMKRKLLERDKERKRLLKRAHLRQGLLELYHRYCFLPLCQRCPLRGEGETARPSQTA
ncbi:MAG TPA: DUF2851 family protein [Armatimonadetes bacterium]|nr:DUF2851 family protein [Armatimonadota bacterium]